MIYLVDFENVRNLKGISAREEDTIVIFYTQNADSIKFDDFQELWKSNVKIELKKVAAGKNALDFQLSSYIGYLIGSNNNDFCIVSNDKGFDTVVGFWKDEKGITINIQKSIKATSQTKAQCIDQTSKENACVDNTKEETEQGLAITLGKAKIKLKQEDINKVVEIVSQYKTRTAINNNLQKHFKNNNKVSSVNKIIKPYLKNKT